MINVSALITLPQYWGSDPLAWRPDRWISKEASKSLEDEHIYQQQKRVFIPFGSRPRVCRGKKLAQVEFVAVIARLFRQHRCSQLLLKGETRVEAKKRVLDIVEGSNLVLTLNMMRPEKVKLIWEDVV